MIKKKYRIFIVMALSMAEVNTKHPDLPYRIKMYSLCTPSHEILRDKYFLPSIKDDYDIIIKQTSQACKSASYLKPGWNKTMLDKVNVIIDAIKDNWGKIFIFSDLDIQYFQSTEPIIVNLMKNKDMIIQRNGPEGSFCAGFFVCYGNKKTLNLWEAIKQRMLVNRKLDDQTALNDLLLYSNPFKIAWSLLPVEFYNGGIFTGKVWRPGTKLKISKDIILHHACYTVGIPNKIAQLDYVKSKVYKRSL